MPTATTHTPKPPYHSHALINIIKMPPNSVADIKCKNAHFYKGAKPIACGKTADVAGHKLDVLG